MRSKVPNATGPRRKYSVHGDKLIGVFAALLYADRSGLRR